MLGVRSATGIFQSIASQLPTNSISGNLMYTITRFRNQNSFINKCIAQLFYTATAALACGETVLAGAITIGCATVCSPDSPQKERSFKWLSSSAFTIPWAVTDFFLNPWCALLVADEASARQIATSGNVLMIPRGAVF